MVLKMMMDKRTTKIKTITDKKFQNFNLILLLDLITMNFIYELKKINLFHY